MAVQAGFLTLDRAWNAVPIIADIATILIYSY